jgi:competence ComEA-like helix-hairpin-helix protein
MTPLSGANLLVVYYFDVDQGDSILLQGPDFTILVDAGRHDRNDVVPQLERANVESIDLLIGTHPHADHIGQFPQVLARYPVSEVWMSGDLNTTRTFENAIDAVAESGAAYHEPRAGEIYEIGSARVEVLNPTILTGDVNEGSVVVRIVFGNVAFLFTGDAEEPAERVMLASGLNLQAQILKLGHHASDTSSSPAFIEAIRPEVAIWSAGIDNTYGHPNPGVLARLRQMGIRVLGTAVNSTIVVRTDGNAYEVEATIPDATALPPTPTPAPTDHPTATVNRNANLRAGPGSHFDVVDQLDKGTPVTPLGRNEIGDWIYVRTIRGQRGWIYRPLIANMDRNSLPLVATPTPTPEVIGCAAGQININAAPANELEQITQIGPSRAQQIIALRPFESVNDLARVSGIGEGTLEVIEAQGLACAE